MLFMRCSTFYYLHSSVRPREIKPGGNSTTQSTFNRESIAKNRYIYFVLWRNRECVSLGNSTVGWKGRWKSFSSHPSQRPTVRLLGRSFIFWWMAVFIQGVQVWKWKRQRGAERRTIDRVYPLKCELIKVTIIVALIRTVNESTANGLRTIGQWMWQQNEKWKQKRVPLNKLNEHRASSEEEVVEGAPNFALHSAFRFIPQLFSSTLHIHPLPPTHTLHPSVSEKRNHCLTCVSLSWVCLSGKGRQYLSCSMNQKSICPQSPTSPYPFFLSSLPIVVKVVHFGFSPGHHPLAEGELAVEFSLVLWSLSL